MEVFTKTDIGLVRKENQDSSAFSVISSSCAWAVVCDGMGGANGGKTASLSAVEHISECISKIYSEDMDDDLVADMLIDAVEGANTLIFEMSKDDEILHGMGTTCDLVFVRESSVFVIHVGDSRTYSIRDGKLLQITEDHSVVQELVNRGEITPDQAQNHPNKNLITRAIGVAPDVHIDYIETEFRQGDVILLCTDGLSNNISKDELIAAVNDNEGELMVDTLVEIAKRHGGTDNITATVIY